MPYHEYQDTLAEKDYNLFIADLIQIATVKCDHLWLSYNANHDFWIGGLIADFLANSYNWRGLKCVQVYTFYQHNHHDLGNSHRPLVRLSRVDAPLYPDAIRVPSWRQLHGDKRADPRGRVPGTTFDFPRVTGNSSQRRKYHPTQLHEGLVERCIKLCARPDDAVCDPFAGTGTTLRVCKRTGNPCILMDIDKMYCEKIAEEHNLSLRADNEWTN